MKQLILFTIAITIFISSCGSSSNNKYDFETTTENDLLGIWNTRYEGGKYGDGWDSGTLNLKSNGIYEEDANVHIYSSGIRYDGRQISGGSWTYENSILGLRTTWWQLFAVWSTGEKIYGNGYDEGEVKAGKGTFYLKRVGYSNPMTKIISR